jgi:hypothetical protein
VTPIASTDTWQADLRNPVVSISIGVIVIVIAIAFSSLVRSISWCLTHYLANWFLVKLGLYYLWLKVPEHFYPENIIAWSENKVLEMKGKVRKGLRDEAKKKQLRRKQEELDRDRAGDDDEQQPLLQSAQDSGSEQQRDNRSQDGTSTSDHFKSKG